MAKFNTTIVTNAGKELFAKVRAGKEQLTWTKAQMYYASNSDSLPKAMLQQATPDYFGGALKETNVGVVEIKGTTVTISSSFLNENQLSDLTFNLIGWFANSSLDQEEKLVAITPSVGDQILTAGATDGKATASIDLVLAIDVGDANIVKITPIEEGLIDHTELNNALALLASKGLINTGNDITSSQNINLDEHFNTSLQYIDDALNDITSTFGSSFSGKGWLMSFGNHENKNNQNNVQLLFDTDHNNQDGYTQHQILFRYFNADYNMWTGWDSLITANNINNFLPGSLSWLDVDNNKPRSLNYIRYGSYGAGMFLPPFLNKLTYSANDENRLKKDNVIVDLDTLLINHAQLMQELGNYYTKKEIDAQNFVKTVNNIKPNDNGDVQISIPDSYTKENEDKYRSDIKQKLDSLGTVKTVDGIQPDSKGDITTKHIPQIFISNSKDVEKYHLDKFDSKMVSGRYIIPASYIFDDGYTDDGDNLDLNKYLPEDYYKTNNYQWVLDVISIINSVYYLKLYNIADPEIRNDSIAMGKTYEAYYQVGIKPTWISNYTNKELDDKFNKLVFNKVAEHDLLNNVVDYGIYGKYYIYFNADNIPSDLKDNKNPVQFFIENIPLKDKWLGHSEMNYEHKYKVLQKITTLDGSATYKRVLTMDFEYNPYEEQKSSSSGAAFTIKPTITTAGWYKYSGTKVE